MSAIPTTTCLNIVALEAHRAGAWVVGEDLGTVEPGVRRELSQRNFLSYKVWWFEADPPAAWPEQALGAVSTHDLPTVAGVARRLRPGRPAPARPRTQRGGRGRAARQADEPDRVGPGHPHGGDRRPRSTTIWPRHPACC